MSRFAVIINHAPSHAPLPLQYYNTPQHRDAPRCPLHHPEPPAATTPPRPASPLSLAAQHASVGLWRRPPHERVGLLAASQTIDSSASCLCRGLLGILGSSGLRLLNWRVWLGRRTRGVRSGDLSEGQCSPLGPASGQEGRRATARREQPGPQTSGRVRESWRWLLAISEQPSRWPGGWCAGGSRVIPRMVGDVALGRAPREDCLGFRWLRRVMSARGAMACPLGGTCEVKWGRR